jgi:hypothetical protein
MQNTDDGATVALAAETPTNAAATTIETTPSIRFISPFLSTTIPLNGGGRVEGQSLSLAQPPS